MGSSQHSILGFIHFAILFIFIHKLAIYKSKRYAIETAICFYVTLFVSPKGKEDGDCSQQGY